MNSILRTLFFLAVIACLPIAASAQTPLPACMQGTVLPPFGDPAQGSLGLWPNGIGPDGAGGYYLPPFTLSGSNPRLMGPLNTEPLVTNFVTAPIITTNSGRSLYVYVQSPVALGDGNVATQVQNFPFGPNITDWAPTSVHFLFLFIRVNGSPWTLTGQYEMANSAVPGLGFAGACTQPVTQNVGWWAGQRIFNNAGVLTEDKPAAAWVGIRTNTPGMFNHGDVVDVMGIWAVEDSPGGPVTVHMAQPFTRTAVAN